MTNVVDYGADPDGLLDSTLAIQAAIDDMPASGGSLLFPDGRYLVSDQVVIDGLSSFSVDGAGATVVLASASPTSDGGKAVLQIRSCEDFTLSGLSILDEERTQPYNGLGISTSSLGVVESVTVTGIKWTGLSVYDDGSPGSSTRVVFVDCQATDTRFGFSTNGDDIQIVGCRVSGPGLGTGDGFFDGINILSGAHRTLVSGCTITDCGAAGIYTQDCTSLTITNNIVTGCLGRGIELDGESGIASDVSIVGNIVKDCHANINLVNASDVRVVGNKASNLLSSRAVTCIAVNVGANNVVVSANQVRQQHPTHPAIFVDEDSLNVALIYNEIVAATRYQNPEDTVIVDGSVSQSEGGEGVLDPWYCTRESVTAALDIKETSWSSDQVDRAIAASSRSIEQYLHRKFYPWSGTKYFDWPSLVRSRSYRLWLTDNEVASVDSLVVAGQTISSGDYFLEPVNSGPPYNRVEMDLSSSATFGSGATHQRAVALTGVFAGQPVRETAAGVVDEAVDSSETSIDVTNSVAIGVGSIIRVDNERMIVTEKSMLDSGENTSAGLAADNSVTTVPVGSGSAFFVGEVILIDAEKMLIVEIAGNNLVVVRAWDGTVLAAHLTAADVYVPRTLTVERGVLGTTAASHSISTSIFRWVVAPPVNKLCIAMAIDTIEQERGAYQRTVGEGESQRESSGRGLKRALDEAIVACGRKSRPRAV